MKPGQQVVLVTGATSGIGQVAAHRFAKLGYRVFGAGRSEAGLKALAAQGVEALPLDVTDRASIAALREEVMRRTGGHGVDVLINNAGYGVAGPIESTSDEDWRRQFETNVFGLVAVTRAFLPEMRRRGQGRVVNISSINGRFTLPFLGVYNASKYAVESLSDALRMELAGAGIQVVLVEPGPIRSQFSERAASQLQVAADSPYAAQLERVAEIQAQFDQRSTPPEVVAAALERVVRARRPRARYVVPFAGQVMLWLVALLPTRWVDGLLRAFMRLNRPATLPQAATSR